MISNLRKKQVATHAEDLAAILAITLPTPKFPQCHWPTCVNALSPPLSLGDPVAQVIPKKTPLGRTGALFAFLAAATVRREPPNSG